MYRLWMIGLIVAGGMTGCGAMGNPAGAQGRVRVVHASPDAPAVDVCVDGAVAFAGAAFPSATAYAALPADTYAIRVVPAGAGCASDAVIAADLPLNAGADVTVVALNALAQIEPLVLTDNNLAPGGENAKVRFVHASPDAPTVDITLTDGTTLFDDVAFKESGGYLAVPAGTYDLQVRDETGATVVLTLADVALAEGGVYTVFAVGLLNGSPALAALVTEDN